MVTAKSIRISFTEEELRALFVECNCCAPPEPYEAAKNKVWRALVKAGVTSDGSHKDR